MFKSANKAGDDTTAWILFPKIFEGISVYYKQETMMCEV
jgi:hypothetical protein